MNMSGLLLEIVMVILCGFIEMEWVNKIQYTVQQQGINNKTHKVHLWPTHTKTAGKKLVNMATGTNFCHLEY